MSGPYLDHPGEMHWFSGYGAAEVLGECPHVVCRHNGTSVIAWGPDLAHYELVECDMDCDSTCRAWADDRTVATTPWLHVAVPPGVRHEEHAS